VTPSSKEKRRAAAARSAADWLQRLEVENLTVAERGELVDWLRESPMHVAEMMRAMLVHRGLSDFQSWDEVAARKEVLEPQADSVVWLNGGNLDPPAPTPQRIRLLTPGRAMLAAACIVALTAAAFVLAPRLTSTLISTQAGERREITLTDGSTITLSPKTALRFRLTPSLRSIQLDRGDALFHVAKDPHRPFVVDAAQADIRAVGTVFNVAVESKSVLVTVTEGRVAVNPVAHRSPLGSESPSEGSIMVAANQQLAVSAAGQATALHPIVSIDQAVLGEPQLSFDSQTVADIVQRFNSVNGLKIRITDDALARRRVSGVFNATDPQSFIAFLEAAAGVASVRRNANEIEVGSPPTTGHSPQHLD
jgi:transmembrane sensor